MSGGSSTTCFRLEFHGLDCWVSSMRYSMRQQDTISIGVDQFRSKDYLLSAAKRQNILVVFGTTGSIRMPLAK